MKNYVDNLLESALNIAIDKGFLALSKKFTWGEKTLGKEIRMSSVILTSKELGERWRVTTETLRYWRWNATGPIYVKINGCVLYRLEDIEQFEKDHLRRHTAMDGVLVNGMEGKMV